MEPKREYKDEKRILTCEKGEDYSIADFGQFLIQWKSVECCLRLCNKVSSRKTGKVQFEQLIYREGLLNAQET